MILSFCYHSFMLTCLFICQYIMLQQQVQEVRQKDQFIAKERKELRTQMKLENVQRVKRMTEYTRMGTLKKIEDSDK